MAKIAPKNRQNRDLAEFWITNKTKKLGNQILRGKMVSHVKKFWRLLGAILAIYKKGQHEKFCFKALFDQFLYVF